ncbi:hypothetical protein F0562_022515 [Nyssa sinensis]|uniref:Uncharacterized protein n=1 Tax=Nyssa sinensis TaxID=561372 RepID=A0A5J5BMZ4_9ASTE|nr:hypothetical protein F0562_022515 [Nyssa sinensis]
MMAPNIWNPSTKTLKRPLRLADSTLSIIVSISHPCKHASILIEVQDVDDVSSTDRETILAQVARMLRISMKDERDVQAFQDVHPKAKERGFGRLFRSPSLFEDAVGENFENECRSL